MTKEEKNKNDEKVESEKIVEQTVSEIKNSIEIQKVTEPVKKEPETSKKKTVQKKKEVFVRAENIPASTKESVAICKFIRGKEIRIALNQLEEVVKLKRALPMKGEIPHRKGNIMSGRYPIRAVKNFIILLKSLAANANYNDIENPIIKEAFANIGQRPYGKSGSVRKKRSHIVLKAMSKSQKNSIKKKVAKSEEVKK
ncbi:MAG TPA: uL22 family ribosomal protein [Candidatus Nanoarchaeia archaeon]|nr:uL22 family ribosomal protein [Candidatus Nanoarchaeia archaeon]